MITKQKVKICESHKHAWMPKENRLLHQIDMGRCSRYWNFVKAETQFMSIVENLKNDVYERDGCSRFLEELRGN